MRWVLLCALLMAAGCGESEEGQGTTFVTIAVPGPDFLPETAFSCWDDPWGDTEFNPDSGEYEWFLKPPPGPCTLLIQLRDLNTGERMVCVQEEHFVVSEVGDTEVAITVESCEPDRTLPPIEANATCLDSAGAAEPDEDGACTFYVSCPVPGGVTFPIKVRPLPTVVAEEGRSRARLEQTLLLTSAIRGSLPEIEPFLVGGRSVEYALEAPSELTTFSAGAAGGPWAPPLDSDSTIPIEFERAEVEFDHDPTTEFSVDLVRVSLSVSFLADELVCEAVGDATVLYSP